MTRDKRFRFLGHTAKDYRRMTDTELLRLTRDIGGWSQDEALVAELKRRNLA